MTNANPWSNEPLPPAPTPPETPAATEADLLAQLRAQGYTITAPGDAPSTSAPPQTPAASSNREADQTDAKPIGFAPDTNGSGFYLGFADGSVRAIAGAPAASDAPSGEYVAFVPQANQHPPYAFIDAAGELVGPTVLVGPARPLPAPPA